MIKITTVADNKISVHKGLVAAHGLSFHIQTNEGAVLFDFGSSKNTVKNAEKLKIKINEITYSVCSHGHYDHSGGYKSFLSCGLNAPLVTGKNFFDEKYDFNGIKYNYIGVEFDEEFISSSGITHLTCTGKMELLPNIYAFGGFHKYYEQERIPEKFLKLVNGKFQKDLFEDEICIVIDSNDGLIIIAGCSHVGILNMLKSISNEFGKPVKSILGGTHLVVTDDNHIDFVFNELKKSGVGFLGLNHCTGDNAVEKLKKLDISNTYLGVGDCIFI